MCDRDKYGNYVNKAGTIIKVSGDKRGKDHLDFYDGEIDGPHSACHIDLTYTDDGIQWSAYSHDEEHNKEESGTGSSSCFLTTACMKEQTDTFDDACHELQTLRWFRDHHVSKEDIRRYYEIAPHIVDAIDAQPSSTEIYLEIYNKVIAVCVRAIEQEQFTLAYDTYRDAVLRLEARYISD